MSPVTVVLYHHIADRVTPFEANLAVTTRPEVFDAHVDWFAKNYDVIDLDTLIDGPLPKRPLLITFDDLYASVMGAARDSLVPRNLPSVFFVNPDLLGDAPPSLDACLSWWQERRGMNALCDALGVTPHRDLGTLLGSTLSRWTAAERSAAVTRLLEAGGPTGDDLADRAAQLTPADLADLKELGMAVGNHTATHVHGRGLAKNEHNQQIVQAKIDLEALSGQRVRAFSFPYGHEADATPAVLDTVRTSGHEATFLVHARRNSLRPAPDIWYRVSLHNEPVSALPRALWILPAMRMLKARLAG